MRAFRLLVVGTHITDGKPVEIDAVICQDRAPLERTLARNAYQVGVRDRYTGAVVTAVSIDEGDYDGGSFVVAPRLQAA